MKRMLRFPLAALLLCLCTPPGFSDSPPDVWRKEDERLEKRVTLEASRLYIGELLHRLSAQSGVSLQAEERDGAADVQAAIFLKDVPLGDAMDALWSLVSYQRAAWKWERTGNPGSYRYRLTRPLAAQQLAIRLQNWVQEVFEESVATLLVAAQMSPQQREQIKDKLAAALLHNDVGRTAQVLQDSRFWTGLKVFAETLSPDARLRVLRGQESIRVPLEQLSEEGREFAQSKYHGPPYHVQRNGVWEPVPIVGLQFLARRGGSKATPSLGVHVVAAAPGTESVQGQSYAGGQPLEQLFRKRMYTLWTLPGDAVSHSDSERKIAPPPLSAPDTAIREKNRALEKRVEQLARFAPVALIARLPREQRRDPGSPSGKTIERFLEEVEKAPLMHKWRGNILLLSSRMWYFEEETGVSRRLIEQLRKRETAGGGFLSWDDLLSLADLLREEQLKQLTEEFPVMAGVKQWRSVLRLCYSSPQAAARLRSQEGLPITEEVASALRAMPGSPLSSHLQAGKARALRLIERKGKEGETPARTFWFQLLSAEGKVLTGLGFQDKARNRSGGLPHPNPPRKRGGSA